MMWMFQTLHIWVGDVSFCIHGFWYMQTREGGKWLHNQKKLRGTLCVHDWVLHRLSECILMLFPWRINVLFQDCGLLEPDSMKFGTKLPSFTVSHPKRPYLDTHCHENFKSSRCLSKGMIFLINNGYNKGATIIKHLDTKKCVGVKVYLRSPLAQDRGGQLHALTAWQTVKRSHEISDHEVKPLI
jgi:hypothetical protein